MSDDVAAVELAYAPEAHAPDPVFSHGDPTPPGKVAIWLFLASEIMFFVAILGTYVVLRSGSPHLFSEHAAALSKIAAGVNTLVLIFSSLTMALSVDAAQRGQRQRMVVCLALTFLCACAFMGIKAYEYGTKFAHHTIVAKAEPAEKAPKAFFVYDGHKLSEDATTIKLRGFRMPLGEKDSGFDIHLVSEEFVRAHPAGSDQPAAPEDQFKNRTEEEFTVTKAGVNADVTYGPWKNIFYSCYFTLTGIHGLHVLGGMIPLGILLVQGLRGRVFAAHVEYVGLYWHFVDLIWIFLFPLLYLI